jgi:hypothetical protein
MINIDNIQFWHVAGTFFLLSNACRVEFEINETDHAWFFRAGIISYLAAYVGSYKPWPMTVDYFIFFAVAIALNRLINKSRIIWWCLLVYSTITGYALSLNNISHDTRLIVGTAYWLAWGATWLFLSPRRMR